MLPRRERDSPADAAQRYAREVVQLLSANTAEGFVFRVDLRLRPQSEVTPLALPFGAALSHYEGSALTWERAAFIRARAAAGDVARGEEFLADIDGFVWRRSLDFGAIDEVRRLTRRIREKQGGPATPAPGYNVKLGRGGIREVEFFVQTLQMIHGGRNPVLRVADTAWRPGAAGGGEDRPRRCGAAACRQLRRAANGRTPAADGGGPADAYPARWRGAGWCGAAWRVGGRRGAVGASGGELRSGGRMLRRAVGARTGGGRPRPYLPDDQHGITARVADWDGRRFRALRSEAAQQAFEAVHAQLTAALMAAPDPLAATARMAVLLERLPTAINTFRLLQARPALFGLLTDILALAPPLADRLGRRPELLDALIDRSAFDLPGSVAELAGRMRRTARDESLEARLDAIRIVTGEVRFALGVQLIEGAHDPLAIGAGLARLAEAGLVAALDAAQEQFAASHGQVAGGELVVLALGRLGGQLLTHASDLDLIYLFTGGIDAESAGRRPLGATLYFNRLASRLGAALSVPTAEGALYEVDTRLRPQGGKGPLAASLDSFRRYQLEEAWTWEHMALTRARVVAGSDWARQEVEAAIARVLTQERDPAKLKKDVLAMRAEMAAAQATQRTARCQELLRGGLVDLEFIVHYLQLRERQSFEPDLGAAIAALSDTGLLGREAGKAYADLNRVLIAARLLAPDLQPPHPAAAGRLAEACGAADYPALLGEVEEARRWLAQEWRRVLGEALELG